MSTNVQQALANPGGVVAEVQTVVAQAKSGYKTTEFYVGIVPMLIPLVAYAAKLLGYDVNTTELAGSLAALIPGVGYIAGRSYVKRSPAPVSAVVAKPAAVPASTPVVDAVTVPVADSTPAPVPADVPVPLAAQIAAEVTAQVAAQIAALPTSTAPA